MLSVVTPAYREGHRIFASLALLRASLDELGEPYEIILVSDGSDDDTVEQAGRHADIRVLHYPKQKGKGHAIRYGIAHATGTIIAFIDSDMELHPEGIGRLVTSVRAGADVAIGSKRHVESQVQYPLPRRVQSYAYQLLVRVLFRLNVSDTQTGLKVFRGDLLRSVAPTVTSDGFAFDLELLVALHDAGATIVDGPVRLDYSFETTTGISSTIQVLRDTLQLFLRRRRHASRRGASKPSSS